MLMNILIAAIIIIATVGIHASAMMLAVQLIRKKEGGLRQQLRQSHLYRVSGIVLLMFLASLIEVLVWAFVYLWLNAIEGVEQAFYFSMVTMSFSKNAGASWPPLKRQMGSSCSAGRPRL
jgi:hypothetical protein